MVKKLNFNNLVKKNNYVRLLTLFIIYSTLIVSCSKTAIVSAPPMVVGSTVPMDGTTKGYALAVSLSIQNNNWELLDSLLDSNFTYSGDGLNYTRDEYIGFMQDMKIAFAEMKMTFNHVHVDGEFVTINFTSHAKNVGSFMGAPATSKYCDVNGTLIRQIRNGKAIQEWQTTDLLGLMTQMGFGALQGYTIGVGLLHSKLPRPIRKK